MRILIVDDSAMMRKMIRRVLDVLDLPIEEVFEAANGADGLKVLQTEDVDVLLTDINMPVMTGTELLREMQARDQWRGIVRVVITTDGSDSRRHEADGLSVSVYVEKPFRPEEMRDVLTSLTTAR